MDDRLQTTCNKSGKHDCRCEEEDASPLSPTIRSNGERKRRRSLPCGPPESPCVTSQPVPLPSLQEHIPQEIKDNANPRGSSAEMMNNNRSATRNTLQNRPEQNRNSEIRTRNNLNSDYLEHWFKMQLKIEKGHLLLAEKRCKRTAKEEIVSPKMKVDRIEESYNNSVKNSTNGGTGSDDASEMTSTTKGGGLLDNFAPFAPAVWPFVSSWQNSNMNSKFQSLRGVKEARFNDSERSYKPLIGKDALHNAPNDPYAQPTPFHESNPGPSTYKWMQKLDNSACTVHQSCSKNVNKIVAEARVSTGQDALIEISKEASALKNSQRKTDKSDLGNLMWKLSIPDEKDKSEEGGLLDWFSKVSGRVLGVAATKGSADGNKAKSGSCLKQPEHPTAQQQSANEIKFKNCNLELSPREVDEVLAVLRARTPSGRRRSTVKNMRRRGERSERSGDGADKILAKCASPDEETVRGNSTNRSAGPVCRICSLKHWNEDCNREMCKMVNHQIPEEQPSPLDRVYYDKNVYHPTRSKLADRQVNGLNEVRANGDADHLQNISTKADVLLRAILRTSKDQKDSPDVSSNGTSPKSATTVVDDDSSDDDSCSRVEKLDQQDNDALSNDDKSLPLNKRFHRIRQLFKKEVDKRIAMMGEEGLLSSETTPSQRSANSALLRYNNEQPNLHNARSKVKRRIDFVNFPEVTEKKEDAVIPGAKEAHRKQREARGTNQSGDRECGSAGLNNRQDQRDRRSLEGAKEPAEDEERSEKKDIAVLQKNNLITPTTAQNGHLSSKRNGNHKDGTAETGDDETVDKSVPSALEQERFRRSLENAASMVFHSRTGLPLTSSPAPLRRGSCCFDYDSSLNSVSSKRKYVLQRIH